MRCFTVNEEVQVGFKTTWVSVYFPGGPGEPGVELPMNQDWCRRLGALDKRLAETGLCDSDPLQLQPPLIVSAELQPVGADGLELTGVPLTHPSTKSLVLVQPPFGNVEATTYTSAAFHEVQIDGRVSRTYLSLEEAKGVEIVVSHNNHLLLILDDQAMFRTHFKQKGEPERSLLFQWRAQTHYGPELVLVNQQRKVRTQAQAVLASLQGGA